MLRFIYDSKLIKACLLVIQLALFMPVLGEAQAPVQGQEAQTAGQEMPSLDQLLSPDMFSGLGADLEEEQERELELRQANFEKLPQHIKDAYNAANQKYVTFLKQIDIKNGLKELCSRINTRLDLLTEQKKSPECSDNVGQTKKVLNKFEEALFAGVFKAIPAIPKTAQKNFLAELLERIKAGVSPKAGDKDAANSELAGLADFQLKFDENDKKNEEAEQKCKFEAQDFAELFDSLGRLYPIIKELEDVKLLSDIINLRNLVVTVQNDNQSELVKRYIKFVLPMQTEASQALRSLKKLINIELAPLKKTQKANFELGEEDPKINASMRLYCYWLEDVEKSLDNIHTFESLKSSASSIIGQGGWLFDKIGFIYDLGRPILSFYLKEKYLQPSWGNWLHKKKFEWGIDLTFLLWMRTIQDYQKSKPQLDSHVLKGAEFGKASSPMDMIGQMLSSMSSGGGSMEGMMETMVLGMMNGSTNRWEKRLASGGLFLLSFFSFASTPKGLTRSLKKLLVNYPRIEAISQELKDIATEYGWQVCKARYNTGQWSAYPSYDMKNKLRIEGMRGVSLATDWTTKVIEQLLPSFWTHCDRFTAGIVNPEIFKSLTPKIFDLYLLSSGKMDNNVLDGGPDLRLKQWFENANNANTLTAIENGVQPLLDNKIIDEETALRYAQLKVMGNNTGNIQRYVIESMLVSHVISCFGTKLAQVTVKWFQKPLFGTAFKLFDYATDKMLSIGQALHILNDEDREDMSSFKSDVNGMFDHIPQMLHQLIAASSNNSQGMDMLAAMQGGGDITMMMSMLLKQYMQILPTDSPEMAEHKTVVSIIGILTSMGILSYSDGYSSMKTWAVKMRLAQFIASVKDTELGEEFVVDFTGKLAKYSVDLAKDFTKMVNSANIAPKIALSKISRRLDVEFAKMLTDKIKVGIFAGVLSKTVFIPLINQTVGNYVRDNWTIGDGVDWAGGKAKDGVYWLVRNGY